MNLKLESTDSGENPKGEFYKLLKETNDKYGDENKGFEQSMTYSEIFRNGIYLGTYGYGNSREIIRYIRDFLVYGEKRYVLKHNFNHIASLCKILPGSSSSQILITLATLKSRSIFGGFLSFIGFNLPSLSVTLIIAFIMRSIKIVYKSFTEVTIDGYQLFNKEDQYYLYIISVFAAGIGQGAISLLFQGWLKVLVQEATSKFQTFLIIFACIVYYLMGCNAYSPAGIMLLCGLASLCMMDSNYALDHSDFTMQLEHVNFIGWPCLMLCLVLYIILFLLNFFLGIKGGIFDIMESFYRMGCLLFAGGHMIAPFLLTEHCDENLVEEADILNGLAFASLLPGPIANISGYVGTLINGVLGGVIATFCLFLPGMLIALGCIKYIDTFKRILKLQYFLKGVCSGAIGILITAIFKFWYDSCFVNPYSNIHMGTINIIICYLMLDKLEIPIPLVLSFGSMFSFFSFLIVDTFRN